MMKTAKFLYAEFIFNGHLQSLGAVGIAYISSVLAFSFQPGVDLLILIYCIFQTIYYFDRFRDLEKDSSTNPQRTAHIKKYLGRIPAILGFLVIVLIFINLRFGNELSMILSLSILVLGILYPLVIKGITKYIFMFKNFYVGVVHALLVIFPCVYYHLAPNTNLSILFGFVFAEAMISQIVLDIKDSESDKKAGLLTFPAVYGVAKSISAVQILTISSFLFFLALSNFIVDNNIKYVAVLFAALIINLQLTADIKKKKLRGIVLAAGKFFLWFCVVFVINIII